MLKECVKNILATSVYFASTVFMTSYNFNISPKISIYLMFQYLPVQLESVFDVLLDSDDPLLSRDVRPKGLNSFRSRLA